MTPSDIKVNGHNTPRPSRHQSANGLVRTPRNTEFKELGALYPDKPAYNTPRCN